MAGVHDHPGACPPGRTAAASSAVHVTPVAFRDLPLLNTVGVHEPFALRSIVEVVTEDGTYGLGESYGDLPHLKRLEGGAELVGLDVHDLNDAPPRSSSPSAPTTGSGGHGMGGMVMTSSTADRVLSPFEVAALDIQGKLARRAGLRPARRRGPAGSLQRLPLLQVGRPPRPADDSWGAALDPEALVARPGGWSTSTASPRSSSRAGSSTPDEEIAAIKALRAAFPDHPLRLDPNAAWTVSTSIRSAQALDGVLEYLEDPTADDRGDGRGRPRGADAAGHQHVRGRLRPPAARDRGRTPSR